MRRARTTRTRRRPEGLPRDVGRARRQGRRGRGRPRDQPTTSLEMRKDRDIIFAVLAQSLVASNYNARTILGYNEELVSHTNLFSLANLLFGPALQQQIDSRQCTIDMIRNLLADPVPQQQLLLLPSPSQGAMVSLPAAQLQPEFQTRLSSARSYAA